VFALGGGVFRVRDGRVCGLSLTWKWTRKGVVALETGVFALGSGVCRVRDGRVCGLSLTCQYLRLPVASPESIHSPECDQQSECTAASCACCVASKLNEKPDQRLNIPLKVAVMKRRPSAIQTPALTDERSLLSAEWMKRVQAEAAGLERVPRGGSISTAASLDASSVYGVSAISGLSVRSLSRRTAQEAKSTVFLQKCRG